ncbi:MAG TPA: tetratricopeptide repeat protein [Geobacteraceae bacterium]
MSRARTILAIALTIVLTVAVYGRVATFDFVDFDDYQYVTRNPALREGITLRSIQWAFTTFYASNWHPLTWFSHLADVQLFGFNPAGHHLISLLFHTANAVILLVLLRSMTGSLWRSSCVALLFALHPLHVESVAYVAERKDVLSAFFWLLTLAAYLHYTRRPGGGRYSLVIVAYVLGLLAKPMVVTLPFVLLLLDYWPLRRLACREQGARAMSVPRLLLEKVPLIGLAAASSFVTYVAQRQGGSVSSLGGSSLQLHGANALLSYVSYMGKTFWPTRLAAFYPLDPLAVTWPKVAGAALVMIFLTGLFLGLARRHPYVAVGWLWYVGTLVPAIGLVRVGEQAMADRYTYLPLIGLFIIAVWGSADLVARWWGRRLSALAGAGVLVAMVFCTWFQVGYWRNSFTLFGHAARVTERNWLAEHNLATAYIDERRYDEAVFHLNEALRYRPAYASAYNNLGNVYVNMGRRELAIENYRKALDVNPDFVPARRNLVRTYLSWGMTDQARAEYEILKDISPEEAAKVWPH